MIYMKGRTDFAVADKTVISLGKFDGLHTGHKLLIENMLKKKNEQGLKAVVFTFDMPPKNRVENEQGKVLTTNNEKMHLFERAGADYLIECPFTDEIRSLEAEDFIKMLVERLNVRCFVVGDDFRFGHNRKGDWELLKEYATVYGYEVNVLEKVKWHERDVSSTYIREEIAKGNIESANHLLGYPYFVEGEVVYGNQLGRTVGIPTANIIAPDEKLLPPFGVYAVRTIIEGREFYGITNVGRKPTVGDSYPVGIETNIFDFDENIYGKMIQVEFLTYIRPEMKFESFEDLTEQMNRDCNKAKNWIALQ